MGGLNPEIEEALPNLAAWPLAIPAVAGQCMSPMCHTPPLTTSGFQVDCVVRDVFAVGIGSVANSASARLMQPEQRSMHVEIDQSPSGTAITGQGTLLGLSESQMVWT
jgi:hypothetical protein